MLTGTQKNAEIERLRQRFDTRFAERDAIRKGQAITAEVMEEIAWEVGFEHASNGLDAFEPTFKEFAPLARDLGTDLRIPFDAGFRAGRNS